MAERDDRTLSGVLPKDAAEALANAANLARYCGPPGDRRREEAINVAIAYVYARYPECFREEAIREFRNKNFNR